MKNEQRAVVGKDARATNPSWARWALAIAVCGVAACAGNDEVIGEDEAPVVAPNVRVAKNVSDAKVSSTNVVLAIAGNEDLDKLAAGDIIVGRRAGTEANPSGFLRRVRSVKRSGGFIEIATENASLSDAVEKGRIKETVKLSDIVRGGKTKPQARFDLGSVGFDLGGLEGSATDGDFSASARLTKARVMFEPSIDIGASFGFFRPAEFHAVATGDFDAAFGFEVSSTGTSKRPLEFHHRELLDEGRHFFSVGIIPVEVTVRIFGGIRCDVGASGDQTLSFEASAKSQVRLGIQWTPSRGVEGISDQRFEFDRDGPRARTKANMTVNCRPSVSVALMFFDFVGPTIEVGPTVGFGVAPPRWRLDAGLDARVGGEIQFFGMHIASFDRPLFSFTNKVGEGELQ